MPAALTAVTRLPCYIAPAEDEALASWFTQMSAQLGQSPLMLGRLAFGVDGAADPEWWRRPSDTTLCRISDRTGLGLAQLQAMTFLGWATAHHDESAARFTGSRWRAQRVTRRRGRPVAICRQCVAGDERPYVRRLWMLGWAAACPEHRTVLTGQCPRCWCPIQLYGLNASWPVDLLACQRCGARLAGPKAQPAHAAVLDVQDVMVRAKRMGAATLPIIGETQWAALIAAADTLQAMVWTATAGHRERLFKRIGSDLALGALDHTALSLNTNYGGLLMVGWLLTDLPNRMPIAAAALKTAAAIHAVTIEPSNVELETKALLGKGRRPDKDRVRRTVRET